MSSPQALPRDGVNVISRPQDDVGASLALGTVVAGAGWPLGWLWVDFCQLDFLDGLVSL
jgi:hypothetical protein